MAIVIPDQPTFTSTYIKFGSAPISVDDYDAYAVNGGASVVGLTTFSNQTVVYVWGDGA